MNIIKRVMVLSLLYFVACVPVWAYEISGTITGGVAVGSITVSLSGAASKAVLTNSAGSFKFTGLNAGTYTIIPEQSGLKFTPGSATRTISNASITDVSFTASKRVPSLSIIWPTPGTQTKSNGTVTAKFDVQDFSLTATGEGEDKVAEGSIIVVLWKETLVGSQTKQEPWMGFFHNDTEYTFNNLTPGTYTIDLQLADMFHVRLPAKAKVTFGFDLKDWNINPVTDLSAQSNNDSIRLKWKNPPVGCLKGVLILRDTVKIMATPTTGATYTVGDKIGSATVIYNATATSYNVWQDEHVDNYNLTLNETYHYAVFCYKDQGTMTQGTTTSYPEYSPAVSTSVFLSNIAPSQVTDLDSKYKWEGTWYAMDPTDHSMILNWTAPGGDGAGGIAGSYTIKYSTSFITEGNFDSCLTVPGIIPTPSEAGGREHMVVIADGDLKKPFGSRTIQPETQYYFALKASDGVSSSPMSNLFPSGGSVASGRTKDMTSPGTITDLGIVNPTSNSLMLVWTSPGDDGTFTWHRDAVGHADTYDIRYSTSTIIEANWAYAKSVPNAPMPSKEGQAQVTIVSGLSLNADEYYFGIKTMDEEKNFSGLSNIVSIDRLMPGNITDLKAGTVSASTIDISWKAPGDNGSRGTITAYDIRYSTSPITEASWSSCQEVFGEPQPLAGGSGQTWTVTGLNFNTKYYLALKAIDDAGNLSPLSNCIYGITTGQFPAPPGNLSAIAMDSQLIFSWSPTNVPDVGGYLVYYGTISCAATANKQAYNQPVDAGNACTYTLTGLDNGTKYYIAVRAYNTNNYPSDYSMEITGEPLGMGYQFLPQSVIIPMGGQQANPVTSPLELDQLRNAYKAIFEHVKNGGSVAWTASNALPYDGKNYLRGTFISEFSTGSGTTFSTLTAVGTLTGFDLVVSEPGVGMGNVLGVTKSYSLQKVRVAVFYSGVKDTYGQPITWEEGYFERLFRMYLWDAQKFTSIDEAGIAGGALSNYDMVIFPAVKKGYMDAIRGAITAGGLTNLRSFVEAGGFLYSQGESNYIAEMAGLVGTGTVDLNTRVSIPDSIGQMSILDDSSPVVFARLSNNMYVLDDPMLKDKEGQTTVARYTNVSGNPPAIVTVEKNRGQVILMNGHPSDKREYYPLALNPVLWAMSQKAGLACDGVQKFNEEVERDVIPGLEADVPVNVSVSFSNFWNTTLNSVEVISVVQKGFKITDNSNVTPQATQTIGTDGTTILSWTFDQMLQGRLTFCYTVFTEANALKKGEAVVCETKAVYTEGDEKITVYALPVKMRAQMAARLVGDRALEKQSVYGVSGAGTHFDVKFPIENKEDTEARKVYIQDLVALVSPAIDPTNYRRIPSAVWNTNNGNNHSIWIQNEAYFFQDGKYPLPAEAENDIKRRFNINDWDGKTTYVFEQPEGSSTDIVVPDRYKSAVWGPEHNVPLIQKTETGDIILPAYQLTWPSLAKGTDGATIQGYDYLEPAIRYGIRAIELPPDGVEYARTILMKTLPNIPDNYVVNGKVIMDAPALGFMILLGGDPIPYRELLASSGAYAPRVTDPADIPMLTYQDIWNRPHTATLRTMDPQYAKVSDFFPTVKLHPEVNDTFELFEDTNNNDIWDTNEKLFLEYDITKKAKLHLVIKTGNISTEFPDVVKPADIYNLNRDQNVITCSVFKGLGYNIEYGGHWSCDDLQKIGNPTQLVKEFDTDMFHVLQFQQRLDAGKREQINVYATMTTYPDVHREGFMKVNDGTEYVYHTPKAGPNQYQIFNAHVQGVFGIGNNVEVTKKVAPVNIGNYGDTIYHIIKVEDPYEPRQFEMDPYLRSYGFGGLASTIFVGGRENENLYSSRLHSGESTMVRIEVCNNLGDFDGKAYHLTDVKIEPDASTVPGWMSISQDVLWNTIPPIHGDLVYLLASQTENPAIYESWKGVLYFKITTNNIPDEAKGKVHPIKFKLSCTDPGGKLTEFRNLSENTTKSIIPEAWIGVYDDQGKITTTYGKANIVTLKDGFPDFVQVEKAKLMTESEKETFIGQMGWDIDQYPRGTSASVYFDGLGAGRDISTTQVGSNVTFKMSSITDPKATATTVPWTYDGTETKTFYVVVKSETAVGTSGMKMVNSGANVEYTDHFSNIGTSASTSQSVVAHGPRVEMGYILDGVRRGFNQVLTKELIMGEKNDVELRITLSNEGDNIANKAKGTVTLGSGVTLGSSSILCRKEGDTVIWDNLGDIAPGAVKEVKITVSITPPAGTTSSAPMLKAASKKAASKSPPIVRAAAPTYTLITTTGINFEDSFTGKKVTPSPKGSLTIMAAPAILTAPNGLVATSHPGSVSLSWNAVTAAKGYNVYRSEGINAGTYTKIAILGTKTSYVDITMDEDITYCYVVTAVDGTEESSQSNPSSAAPGDIWPPATVILKSTVKTESSITLEWTSPGDNGSKGTVTVYDIRRSVSPVAVFDSYSQCDGEPVPIKAGENQNIPITDLQPSTTYYFYLKSCDEIGNWSGLSNKLSITTNAAPTLSTSTRLSQGWNLYSLPLKSSTKYTSQSLGAAINIQSGKCTIVQSWQGGAWKTRKVDVGIGDTFTIEIGKGYFVYCESPSVFTVSGVQVKTQQLQFVPGWNLIGLPIGTMSGRLLGLPSAGTISSNLLGKDIRYQDGTCTVIQSWNNLASKWLTTIFTDGFPDGFADTFDITLGKGYFVYANEGSLYSPNRITLSNVGSNTAVVSYTTWDNVSSWLRYGTNSAVLTNLVYDIRGEGSQTTKHYVNLSGLAPNTTYYYDIITSGSTDDNNEKHYSFKTGGAISAAGSKIVSGKVGGVSKDAMVYVRLRDTDATGDSGVSAWASTRTNSSGAWSVDINTIRKLDMTGLFSYSTSGDTIEVVVDGNEDGRGKKTADTSLTNLGDITLE